MFERFKASKLLKELEERCETLERQLKAVRLEWDDAYERMMRLQQRVTKRAQIIERKEAEEQEEAPEVTEGFEGVLSEHQRKVNASILARRSRNGLLPR